MKNHIQKLSILTLFILLLVTSCRKESVESNDALVDAPEASSKAAILMETIQEEATYRMSPTTPVDGPPHDGCPTITFEAPLGTYPNTILLNYGDGCTGNNGTHISGQIKVEVTAAYFDPGSVRNITTQNLVIDGNKLKFSSTETNMGANEEGLVHWTVAVDLVRKVGTGTSSNTTSWTSDRVRTLVIGLSTMDDMTDDVYEITGKASGTGRNGYFSSMITVPLVKRADCSWIVSGIESITSEGRLGQYVIDYGDGTCDEHATLTLPNGEIQIIKLDSYWP